MLVEFVAGPDFFFFLVVKNVVDFFAVGVIRQLELLVNFPYVLPLVIDGLSAIFLNIEGAFLLVDGPFFDTERFVTFDDLTTPDDVNELYYGI